MKQLPVPPLTQTLERYLDIVDPLLDEETLAGTIAVTRQFADTDGPIAQASLKRFAQMESAAGRNWMSQAWLESYLTGRGNLTLLSNVAFELNWPSDRTGVALAADVIRAFARVHLAYLHDQIEPEVTPRGDVLDMRQWRYLAGGLRQPRPGEDVFAPGSPGAANREVLLLFHGNAAALTISDAAGRLVSRTAIEHALAEFIAHPDLATPAFTAPGYLSGDTAAHTFDELLRDPENAATYERLQHALFAVNFTAMPASIEAHMERSAFGMNQAWPFKPVTIQVGLADGFVGLHIEHSTMDGATVQSIVGTAQAASTRHEAGDGATNSDLAVAPDPLRWKLAADREADLRHGQEQYEQVAAGYTYRIVETPFAVPDSLPFTLSQDACQQFIMLYAQLRAYGRVRSTYEAVDMREYQAGRTECLRPNSQAAVALVTAMVADSATPALLYAALQRHRESVKWCKSGQAISRHLFGLKFISDREGLRAPIFEDAGYAALSTDFLSTTSLGERDRIVRAAFAPTSPGGFGIYYSHIAGGYDFALAYDKRVVERIDAFADGLVEGAAKLAQLVIAAAETQS